LLFAIFGKHYVNGADTRACKKPTASSKIIIVVTIKFPPILNENPKTECSIILRILIRNVNAEFLRPPSARYSKHKI